MRRPGGWRKGLIAYFYLAPALVCLGVVYLYPVWQLLRLSTKKVITYNRTVDVGLANFQFVLGDATFARAMLNNAKLFLAVPVLIFLSLLLAALLHEQIRGWRLYRALIFLPYVLPIPVVGVAFSHMLRLNGVLNTTLRGMGLEALALDWLGNPAMAMVSLLGVIVWKELGLGVILFLARLLSVRQELYDAAQLDGANWWQRIWHISVPELQPVIGFYAILELITMLSWVFSYVFTITGGGPANSTTVIEFYIYQRAFGFGTGGGNLGVAAAVCVYLLLAILIVMFARTGLHWRWRV